MLAYICINKYFYFFFPECSGKVHLGKCSLSEKFRWEAVFLSNVSIFKILHFRSFNIESSFFQGKDTGTLYAMKVLKKATLKVCSFFEGRKIHFFVLEKRWETVYERSWREISWRMSTILSSSSCSMLFKWVFQSMLFKWVNAFQSMLFKSNIDQRRYAFQVLFPNLV